jgi:uncharacterized protein YbcI
MSSEPSQDGRGLMDGDGDGDGDGRALMDRGRVLVRPDGSAAAEISRAIVQLMARTAGRGPTKARTTLDAGHALVVVEDALTTSERGLVAAGEADLVRRQRAALQRLIRDDAIVAVETATGRSVRLLLSDIAPEDGVAIQLFLFEPEADGH